MAFVQGTSTCGGVSRARMLLWWVVVGRFGSFMNTFMELMRQMRPGRAVDQRGNFGVLGGVALSQESKLTFVSQREKKLGTFSPHGD